MQSQTMYYPLKKACILKKNMNFTTDNLLLPDLCGLEEVIDQLQEFGFTDNETTPEENVAPIASTVTICTHMFYFGALIIHYTTKSSNSPINSFSL